MVKTVCNFITRWMALIVLFAAICALCFPNLKNCLSTSWISLMLGFVMFGMGLTLKVDDFKVVFSRPKDIIIGSLAQFTIMPLLAFALSKIFGLPDDLTVGVVLVGCCPGGTASNVITYLAKGDLALSVGMTGVSTILAPVLTPLFVWLLVGSNVDVQILPMILSILQVVILPIILGLLISKYFKNFTNFITPYLPAFSTIMITLIVMIVVSANSAALLTSGLIVILVVILHNVCGLSLGFFIAKLLGLQYDKRTAISIEVGMQNSGLACSLAKTHFADLTMATVPGAIFSVWHNISGAIVAKIYRSLNEK